MADKNPNDMLAKASWTLVESVKDTVAVNLTTAFRDSKIKVETSEAAKLVALITASIEEGYQRGFRTYTKTVEQILGSVITKKNQVASR